MVRKNQWVLSNEERSNLVLSVRPLVRWFVRNKLSQDVIRKLGGFDDALSQLTLETFQAAEDSRRTGIKLATVCIKRFRFVICNLTAKNQIVAKKHYTPAQIKLRGEETKRQLTLKVLGEPKENECFYKNQTKIDLSFDMRQAIDQLDERQKSVVLLHYYEGLDFRKIAKTLGIRHQLISEIHKRAIISLREMGEIYEL